MAAIDSAVTINRPVEAVFRHFLDLDKTASDPSTVGVTKEPAGPTAPGTLFTFDHGKGRTSTMRFTALEFNRRIEIESDVGPAKPAGYLLFEPVDESSTRLTVRLNPNPQGPLKLVPPLAGMIGQRIWTKRLHRIKDVLEAGVEGTDAPEPPPSSTL